MNLSEYTVLDNGHYAVSYEDLILEIEVLREDTTKIPGKTYVYGRLVHLGLDNISLWPDSLVIPQSFVLETDTKWIYVEEIGAFSFDSKVHIRSLTLSDYCRAIQGKAFYFNESIEVLGIGGIQEIDTYAFAGCNNLTQITGNNSIFTTQNGMLYNGSELVLGVNKPTISFKDGTTRIGERAFSFCDKLHSINIPSTVTSIEAYAFSDCSKLLEVTIPSSIEEVGYGAFFGCDSVETITLEDGVERLDGLSFSGMQNLMIVKMTDSVTSISSVLGEETFDAGGRRLRLDCSKSSLSKDVQKYWQGADGELPTRISLKFYTDPNSAPAFIVDGITPGSILNGYIEEADNELKEEFEINGWYYDSSLDIAAHGYDSILNYRREPNGEIVDVNEISLYADYEVIVEYSNVYYTEEADGKITLTGVRDWEKLIESGYAIPSFITYDDTKFEVTRIGDGLFEGGEVSSTMTIPNTIRTIGKAAFRGCTNLTEIVFENGSKCSTIGTLSFAESGLESIVLPDSVKRIRQGAFYGCRALETLTVGANVSEIGYEEGKNHGTFEDCDSLTEIRIGTIGQWLGIDFGNSACNPVSNGGYLYVGSSNVPLSSLSANNIGNEIKEIKSFAFVGCCGIQSVDLSSTKITKVGDEAFSANSDLVSVNIGNGINSIGRAAFSNTSITSIYVPHSVSYVGEFMFNGCNELTTVNVDSNIVSSSMFSYCLNLSSVTIGANVMEIGKSAFASSGTFDPYNPDTTGMSVTFSANSKCSLIDDYAFAKGGIVSREAHGIVSPRLIVFPNVLERIGKYGFKGCDGLYSLALPDSLQSIGEHAFDDCSNLNLDNYYGYLTLDGWILRKAESQNV